MKKIFRKLFASAVGMIVLIVAAIWAFYGGGIFSDVLKVKIGLPSEFLDGDATYKKFADLYAMVSFLGVSIAAALSSTLLLWERRPRHAILETIYWLLLFVALPMTVINYWSNDTFVSRSQQAPLNLVLCLLSCICVGYLISIKVSSFSRLLKISGAQLSPIS